MHDCTRNKGIYILILVGVFVCTIYFLTKDTKKDPVLEIIKRYVAILDPRFKNIPIYQGFESPYTSNKEYIVLCLKDLKTDKYYPLDELMYVVIHELAHIITPIHDHSKIIDDEHHEHTELFMEQLEKLLYLARLKGIPVSSRAPPAHFCK